MTAYEKVMAARDSGKLTAVDYIAKMFGDSFIELHGDRRFADDVLSDFYRFYAKFSSDSVFQAQSLAPMLNVSIHDTEDELSIIEGTIDASQWVSFCPEVPQNVISNIRYNQHYTNQRVVMQKCGMGTGLQEVFTFNNEGHGWRLTSYED